MKRQELFLWPAVGSQPKKRRIFIAIKTNDSKIKGKISFYCSVLKVFRQAFNNYLRTKEALWKYQFLTDAMLDICNEDDCNDTYGRIPYVSGIAA